MSTDQECLCAPSISAPPLFAPRVAEDHRAESGAARAPGTRASSAQECGYRPGELIAAKYELRRLLRNGGMGSIWVARHLMLDVSIAIKLIRTDLPAAELTKRFVAEARLAARLEHPGIVSVFDLGVTERGHPFIAMELLTGEDLREMIARERRIEELRAVQLLLPIAAALASAHDQGIVHRDLKPENVFVARTGDRLQPKLIDFGIAKPASAGEGHVTWAGSVVGSPEYMAPEQALGLPELDHRVDVWGFCTVLYECITGQPPFSGTNESVLTDIVSKPACPITERGAFDAQLSAIIQRGLEREPSLRWQDMRELGRALALWLLGRWVDEDACGHSLRSTWFKPGEAQIPGTALQAPGTGTRSAAAGRRGVLGGGGGPAARSSRGRAHSRPRALSLVATGAALCAIGSMLGLGLLERGVESNRVRSVARSVAAAGRLDARTISSCPGGPGRCRAAISVEPNRVEAAAAPKRPAPPAPAPRAGSVGRSRQRTKAAREYDFGF